MIWTKENIKTLLERAEADPNGMTGDVSNRYLVYRMLQALYKRQTADEQAAGDTKYHNGMGFTGADAVILSDIAQKSIQYKNLTANQVSKVVAKRLKKYAGQLALVAAEKAQTPLPLESERYQSYAEHKQQFFKSAIMESTDAR